MSDILPAIRSQSIHASIPKKALDMKYIGISIAILVYCLVIFVSAQVGTNLPFVTSRKWSGFTEREQAIYVKALLETWSFQLHSILGNQGSPKEFSAFTACAETEKEVPFIKLIDFRYIVGEVSKPVVAHMFDRATIICEKYINKGDGSWRPVRLIQKGDWEKFEEQEREIYLMGYVDFSHFFLSQIISDLTSKEQSKLDQNVLLFLNPTTSPDSWPPIHAFA